MPNNATLTLRCPDKGHKLVEVIYERGKPMAYCQEYVTRLVLSPAGEPKAIPARSMPRNAEGQPFATIYDLQEEAPDRTQVTVVCKCGRRTVALAPLLDEVLTGTKTKMLADQKIW
jgi:hypothetical protein